jgi:hypothetical protein
MATLKELQQLMLNSGVAPETVALIISEARMSFGGDKIYFPPPGSPRDPARAEKIREAAKKLPTGVTAVRFGVSRSYVHRVLKK